MNINKLLLISTATLAVFGGLIVFADKIFFINEANGLFSFIILPISLLIFIVSFISTCYFLVRYIKHAKNKQD